MYKFHKIFVEIYNEIVSDISALRTFHENLHLCSYVSIQVWLIEEGLMSHQTHYRSYWGRVFTSQMTQPTVSKH